MKFALIILAMTFTGILGLSSQEKNKLKEEFNSKMHKVELFKSSAKTENQPPAPSGATPAPTASQNPNGAQQPPAANGAAQPQTELQETQYDTALTQDLTKCLKQGHKSQLELRQCSLNFLVGNGLEISVNDLTNCAKAKATAIKNSPKFKSMAGDYQPNLPSTKESSEADKQNDKNDDKKSASKAYGSLLIRIINFIKSSSQNLSNKKEEQILKDNLSMCDTKFIQSIIEKSKIRYSYAKKAIDEIYRQKPMKRLRIADE